MCLFFTAGNKWYKVKYRYLGNNGTRMTFSKCLLDYYFTDKKKTNLITLRVTGTAQFYTVTTFTAKTTLNQYTMI